MQLFIVHLIRQIMIRYNSNNAPNSLAQVFYYMYLNPWIKHSFVSSILPLKGHTLTVLLSISKKCGFMFGYSRDNKI